MIIEAWPYIVGIVTFIVGIFALRYYLKKPHIKFSLDRADVSLSNDEKEERITLLLAPITNEKQFLGDTAKGVTGCVFYRAPGVNHGIGLASAGLPWSKPFSKSIKTDNKLQSEQDIQNALENSLFNRITKDIPQGRRETLVVAYGIELTNKMFLASIIPIEFPLPKSSKNQKIMHGCFIRLEVAGENLPSTVSDGTVIIGDSWTNWSFPAEITKIRTPNRFENLLLRLGIGRKQKVLASEKKQ
jgi:hypothetical protein